jgi:hypothetical protein
MLMLPSLDQMTLITQTELLDDFDAILDRVIAGEYFLVKGEGPDCVLMPYDVETKSLIGEFVEQ